MKDYSRIVSKVTTTPWMMMPAALKMMLELLDAHMTGNITEQEIRVRMQSAQQREVTKQRQGMIGVLPLHGPIFPKANMMTEMSGATSLEQWTQDFRSLVADESITSILIDVDSPGGSSELIPETAQMIREARDIKPIYALANTMAASAAYGLASQATKLYASPSSLTGSAGTYMVHTDESGLNEKLGVKETVIKSGRFKAAEIQSLTPDTQQYFQELVGDINERFLNEIAQGRGMDIEAIRQTEGKVFASDRSLEQGLIDQIATFDEVISEIAGGGTQPTSVAVTRSVSGGTTNSAVNLSVPERTQSYDADKEHSEPGTGLGGEPTPREPPEEGDPAIEGGWRRDPPPPAYETEEAVNREWLEVQARTLGIEFNEEVTDEALAKEVADRMNEIVVPLSNATTEVAKMRQFEKDYPEQAAQLATLATTNRQNEARAFADEYQRFDGGNKGFSSLVRNKIQESHEKIAMRQFSHVDLKELLDLTAKSEAVVEWGENGSSREDDTQKPTVTRDFQKDRVAFAELVRTAMREDNLSQEAAIEHVSKQHPDLAEAYLVGHAKR